MLCQNCGENEANVKYTQVINGVKKQMNLCENCANRLGINNMSFSMPMDLFNFMEEMFTDNIFEPQMSISNALLEDDFNEEFNSVTPRIRTRIGHIGTNKLKDDELDLYVKNLNKERKIKNGSNENELKIRRLKRKLEQEIKEEKFEDAAKTRDEIKKLEK